MEQDQLNDTRHGNKVSLTALGKLVIICQATGTETLTTQ